MAQVVIPGIAGLKQLVGTEVAVSDWFSVSQERIDEFAEATDDRQWIHVDRARAAKESPYGSTVAHGFLTLSLLPHLLQQAIEMQGVRMGINYGLNRVRFTGPVPAGARVRAHFRLAALEDIADVGRTHPAHSAGVQITWAVTLEREREREGEREGEGERERKGERQGEGEREREGEGEAKPVLVAEWLTRRYE